MLTSQGEGRVPTSSTQVEVAVAAILAARSGRIHQVQPRQPSLADASQQFDTYANSNDWKENRPIAARTVAWDLSTVPTAKRRRKSTQENLRRIMSDEAILDRPCPKDVALEFSENADLSRPLEVNVDVPALSDTTISSALSSTASNEDNSQRQLDTKGLRTQAQSVAVLTLLARQLEYYFSTRNLARDTYVQTLRTLNDGCVPVSILANFSKVKAIVNADEDSRFHAILQATAEYSDVLQVNSIETTTGKITTDDTPSSATTILAVGPVGREALVLSEDHLRKSQSLASISSYESSPAGRGTSTNTNTIILREVHPDVTEEEIRELFNFEGCPSIESLRPDVASCWFVTLDTDSRDDMLRVMMIIRMQTLHDDYVQARLKATTSAPIETAPPMPLWPGFTPEMLTMEASGGGKKKKKRKKKNRRNRKKAAAARQAEAADGSTGKNAVPPSLDEDEFPTIQEKKVEFVTMPKYDKPDDDEERVKSLSSDAASTATTNSCSLDSFAKPKPFTGYAAALLKVPSPVSITDPPSPSPVAAKCIKRLSSSSSSEVTDNHSHEEPSSTLDCPVVVNPPIWGCGRSFADILREETSDTTA